MASLTETQVRGLAPDPASLSAGERLAVVAPWSELGHDDRAVWGSCRGSAKAPYRVAVDTCAPAYLCTCPSRKFPCKHALGLLLLWARTPRTVQQGSPPGDVAAWLASRPRSAASGGGVAAGHNPPVATDDVAPVATDDVAPVAGDDVALVAGDQASEALRPPPEPVAAAARAQRRSERIAAGMAELDRWLGDLVRGGLAQAPARPFSYWDEMAARMVDAQAPAAASAVRRLPGVARSGEGWPARLLAQCCRLHLLAAGWSRFEQLPEVQRADLRTAAGWPWPSDQVAAGTKERDRWYVLARSETQEERVTALRTWLWGLQGGRLALILDFARPGAVPPWELWPGTVIDAEVARFPGSAPLRVLITERWGDVEDLQGVAAPPGWADLDEAARARGAVLRRDPWLERWPMSVAGVMPLLTDGRWEVMDAGGRRLPLRADGSTGWQLLALSGGRGIHLLAEWFGDQLVPLGVWSEQRMVGL